MMAKGPVPEVSGSSHTVEQNEEARKLSQCPPDGMQYPLPGSVHPARRHSAGVVIPFEVIAAHTPEQVVLMLEVGTGVQSFGAETLFAVPVVVRRLVDVLDRHVEHEEDVPAAGAAPVEVVVRLCCISLALPVQALGGEPPVTCPDPGMRLTPWTRSGVS